MLTLYIRNVRTRKNIADYKYLVMVNSEQIAEGTLEKHNRADGWAKLVKRIGDEAIAKETTK
jgi:hypothetical protein